VNISLNWDSIKKNASINAIGTMGFGNFIGSVISSIFWIVIAGFLGTENYGQISYLLAIIGIFSVVSMFGGQYTMQVYTSKQIKLESSLYLISIVSGTSLAIILFILFQDIGVSISLIGITVLNFYFSEMIGKKLFSKYSLIYVIQKILFVSFSLILYHLIGFEGILIGYGLSHFIFVKHVFKILSNEKFNLKLLNSKKKIIFYNYASELTATARNNIDKILIVPFFGLSLLGNYFLSMQIISLMYILPGIVIKYTIGEDSREKSTLKVKSITIFISFVLALLGAFVGTAFLPVFFPQFIDAIELLPILSFAVIPRTVSLMIMSKFLATEKNFHITMANLVTFFLLSLGIILSFQFYEDVGLAYSYVIGMAGNSFYLIFIYFYKKSIK